MKTLKKLLAMGILSFLFGCSTARISNNLETLITNNQDIRNRVNTKANLTYKDVQLKYKGLNEATDADLSTYLGTHTITAGGKDWTVTPCFCAVTDSKGGIDKKFGLEDKNIIKALGGQGSIKLVANEDAANIKLHMKGN